MPKLELPKSFLSLNWDYKKCDNCVRFLLRYPRIVIQFSRMSAERSCKNLILRNRKQKKLLDFITRRIWITSPCDLLTELSWPLTFVCYSELPDTATVNTRHTATDDRSTTHEGQIKYTCTPLFYSNRLTCFVITSQLVYACRRPYCFTNNFVSILLSVQCRYCLKTNGHIITPFWYSAWAIIVFCFSSPHAPPLQNSKATRAAPPGMLTMLQRTHLWSWVC